MRKIVHLVVDDKFIDAAIREFEAVGPGVHEYLVVDARPPWKYLKSPLVVPVTGADWARRVAADDVAAVILHGLPAPHLALLRAVPAGPTVAWFGWGYDYYGLMADAYTGGLLLPHTAALVARLQPRVRRNGPDQLAASELSIARPYPKPTAAQRRALSRVDLFSPVLDVEFAMVRRHQPWLRAAYRPWNYLTLEDDLLPGTPAGSPVGPDVLVGNSATPTNNHLEAFQLIRRRLQLDGRRIVVPLSYGDPAYARRIEAAGRELFGGAFMPLLEFMPPDDYLGLLDSCGVVVMNHLRQQALGNVYIAGLRGARLFLNAGSPMTGWLRRRGVKVDDIESLDAAPLSQAGRDGNRDAIARLTCRAERRGQTRRLVEELLAPCPAPA